MAEAHPSRFLLAGVMGIVVHDHWKPYYTMTKQTATRETRRAR